MYYKDFNEYLKANTKDAHKIIKNMSNEEDKETLEDTITWLEHQMEDNHKMMKWLEDATKEICSDKQYKDIMKLYSTFMHNDFITNCEWGKKMFEKGQVCASSSKFLFGNFNGSNS